MATKSLKLTFNDKVYNLEFNRKSIETMERQGFVASDISDKPMTTLPALFAGAFIMHHRFLDRNTIDEIFSHIKNKESFIEKLSEMFNEPLVTLIEEPEDD